MSKKINYKELLKMADEGVQGKEIAQHFLVSPAAVSKRLQHLRRANSRLAILESLTPKQVVLSKKWRREP